MKRSSILPLSLVALVLLVGCTVGPDYGTPAPETLPGTAEESFAAGEGVRRTIDPGDGLPAPDGAWWAALGDAELVRLVDDAVAHNLDLEAARARVRQARAARRAVGSADRPRLDGGASGTRSRASELTPEGALAGAGLTDLEIDRFRVGLSASWELDVFGGVRRAEEAADARLGAADEGRRAVLLGVIAEVARTYTELRGAQRRIALAEKNIGLQEETHRRVRDLHRVGLGSRLDAERAAAQLAAGRARVPPLRAEARAAAHRLAVLTGRPPAALLHTLHVEPGVEPDAESTVETIPTPDLVPVGLPSELLRRRPDLRLAERRLAASHAEIGVAVSRRFPRFFLTGGGGYETGTFSDLFRSVGRTWTLGPSISWPIFRGGQIRAGIDAAEADHDAAWADYRHAVLRAVEDVETALVHYAEEELRRRALSEAARSSAEAARLARVVYDKGLESFLTVLDAERNLIEVEDRLATAETGVTLRLVALYAALGGGWEMVESTEPS